MTTATSTAAQRRANPSPSLVGTARTTGALYLGVAIVGGLGFLLIRPMIFDAADPMTTLDRLGEREQLAHLGLGLEMSLIVLQALTALWFWRLFRGVDAFAAAAIAVFGLMNSFAVLGSAAFLASALDVASSSLGDASGNAQLMYLVSNNLWGVANLAFGLWLIPMGWCVLRSGWMPRPLGWILIAGGVGYVLSAFLGPLAPGAETLTVLLALPATVGEFWMIGYLLVRGVRRSGRITVGHDVGSDGT